MAIMKQKMVLFLQEFKKWSAAAQSYDSVFDPQFKSVVDEFKATLEHIRTFEFVLAKYVE